MLPWIVIQTILSGYLSSFIVQLSAIYNFFATIINALLNLISVYLSYWGLLIDLTDGDK
jgi:hypothetical protein